MSAAGIDEQNHDALSTAASDAGQCGSSCAPESPRPDTPAAEQKALLPPDQWERKKALLYELRKRRMRWRKDSRLCSSFVEGALEGKGMTSTDVAEMMCEMRFLFEYTKYRELRKTLVAASYQTKMEEGIEDAWNEAQREEEPKARTKIFSEVGGKPSQWPWLDLSSSQTTNRPKQQQQRPKDNSGGKKRPKRKVRQHTQLLSVNGIDNIVVTTTETPTTLNG
jgi:hypothetical protein